MKEWMAENWPIVAIVGAVVSIMAVLLVLGISSSSSDTFKEECHAQGGVILSKTNTDTGFDYKGRPVLTTTTTRLCTVDGKVVGID